MKNIIAGTLLSNNENLDEWRHLQRCPKSLIDRVHDL